MKKNRKSAEPSQNPFPAQNAIKPHDLRWRAEAQLQQQSIHLDTLSSIDLQSLVHELRVHQFELELQNEELQRISAEVETGLERYTDLYDFAPVGYFTLDRGGTIRQVNLTGATLLNEERTHLINKRFGLLVSDGERPSFNAFLKCVFISRVKQVFEAVLQNKQGESLWVQLEGITDANELECRVAVVDISERKRAEERLAFQANLLEQVHDAIIATDEHLIITWWNHGAEVLYGWTQAEAVGQNVVQLLRSQFKNNDELSPDSRSDMVYTHEVVHYTKAGKRVIVESNWRILKDSSGQAAGFINANRDISARKQAEEDIRQQAARAEALVRNAARLNARLDLDTLLRTVCEETAHAMHSPAAWINLYDAEQDEFYIGAAYGLPCEFTDHYQTLSRALYERYIDKPGPIWVTADAQVEMEFPNQALYAALDIRTVVFGKMEQYGEMIGTLQVISYGEERCFSEDELTLMEGLTHQAAQAIANTRLFEQISAAQQQLQQLSQSLIEVQEAERRSLALELHDELGQLLSTTKMSLDIIPTLPKPAADEHLQRASALIGGMVSRVRHIVLDLRPNVLDELGLLPALNWLFKNYQSQSGEPVTFIHSGLERRFPAQVEITAYRIIQEALTNVMRHAGNKQVAISIQADDQQLNLKIVDFGAGFDPGVAHSRRVSSGLSGMRERANLLGGKMVIESAPGKGTCLTVRLPVAQKDK